MNSDRRNELRDLLPSTDDVDPGAFASDAELECLLHLDLAGEDGHDGVEGESYFDPVRRPGANGRRGGDATPAGRGEDAASATLELGYATEARDSGWIDINGTSVASDQSRHPLRAQHPIGNDGYVFIDATGGRGGNGGKAGNGQPGARGYKGRDATRYSSGGNGGPGGNGGDAGEPSDGELGGSGGEVTLVVDADDLGLLMLIKGDLAGGDLGFAGEGGIGGRGGPGGPGGNSYHWTETAHYTDSQGKRQTRTVFRSNPGGFAGRDGHPGNASRYRARDGQAGRDGRLSIVVKHVGGTQKQYDSPYDLRLVSFDLAPEYGILEPDSLASVDSVTVLNCGGMPTPSNYTIRTFLPSDEWLHCDQVDLVLPHSLVPGESYTFSNQSLRFRFADVVIAGPRKRGFSLNHSISPVAYVESGIHRPFRDFENQEEVQVRFPIELTDVIALNSLAPGESTRVRWGITNLSEETFDDQMFHRSVQTGVRLLGGDVDLDQLLFFDDTDAPRDLLEQEYRSAVRNLEPGETRWIETRIGIRDHSDVIAYQAFVLGVDLHQQRPGSSDRHDQYRRVDYRQETIRVSETYRRDEGSRFLLIANQKTDVDDIQKWTQLADYFGSGLDVWDVAYYGFLDFVRKIDRDKSLLEQWQGMTVIIPNNYYLTAAGKTAAFNQLAKSQFLQAAADFDISFYVVGDSRTGGEELLANSLIPISAEKSASQLKTERAFLKRVRRWSKYVAASGEVVGGVTSGASDIADASLGAVHEFEINKRTLLFQPKPKWLEQEARDLQRKLKKVDPLHRWVIVHRYDTGDTDTSWGFFRKRKIGKLEVRRTLDSSKGSAVLFEADAIDVADQDFINSEQNKHGIFLALKFEDKVDRFIRLVSERTFPRFNENYIDRPLTDEEIHKIGHELIDSILVDIYNEQQVARTSRTWAIGGVRPLMPKLNYLAERSLNYGVTYRQMKENEATLCLLYELLANIRYMATHSRTIWDSAIFPTAFFKRSRAVSTYMANRVDRIIASIFGPKLSWWDKWTAPEDYDPFGTAKNAIPQGAARDLAEKEIAKWETELAKRKTPLEKYTSAQTHPGLTYDPELLPENQRVLSGKVYDQLVKREQDADMQRAKLEYAVAKQRSELLVPLEKADRTATENVTPTQKPTSL
ncbi:DUF7932 domain-containing protein [Novipirellula artificiosorum]|uniref:DUF7932 domain-containing protein n=1 Tax=Novipirellula artificiosorum TaxID=2528016 RepID=A0A5C6DLX7_9BACT|nr:hypothetical protein [Novipirellula artificiosorum]TWU35926.1 hypothetical protein Poly41_36780 [Novipirellula artificiosorum]